MSVISSAKKVRPSAVNLSGVDANQNCISQIPFHGDATSPWSTKSPGTPTVKVGIQDRLVDSFFHQHKDLQQLCEIIVDHVVKNFSKKLSQSFLPSIFKNAATQFDEYSSKSLYILELKARGIDALKKATTKMNTDFDRIIKKTLQLLAPPGTKSMVVDVACSLAITHATQKGSNIINTLISEEKKKLADEFVRKEKKSKAGMSLSSLKRGQTQSSQSTEPNNAEIQSIIDLTTSLRTFDELGECSLEQLKQQSAKVMDQLQTCFAAAENSQLILAFVVQIVSLLKKLFSNSSSRGAYLLEAIIEVTEVLSLLGKLEYVDSSNKMELELLLCKKNNMLELVSQTNSTKSLAYRTKPISHKVIGDFLFMLIEGSLVCHRLLEKALLQSAKVSDDGKLVSNVVLDRLASSQAGKAGTEHALLIMPRLHKVIRGGQLKPRQNLCGA